MGKKIFPFSCNNECLDTILSAIDYYTNHSKDLITISDIQNFLSGYSDADLNIHTCWLIQQGYINGKFDPSSYRVISIGKITKKGYELFESFT